MSSPVRIEREEGNVALLVVDRPEKRNALDKATVEAFRSALRELKEDATVHALVVTGVEKSFVAGADIAEMRERRAEDALRAINASLFREVEDFPRPVIAAINGFALGGGCELALACDVRIAAKSAKLGQPEVGLGIIPAAGGCYRLARVVGLGRAKELIFTGRIITADEALAIGLVEEVVADGEAKTRALALAREIARQAPMAVRLAKSALNAFARGENPEVLLESTIQAVLYETEE
ncbi:MAG TPA: enoyl-CoA hydratase-related protein, partial [Planctomycetota bacterium]|nr:enoyl-CoA hydratase-related protein [Planctomycetota bacterium]